MRVRSPFRWLYGLLFVLLFAQRVAAQPQRPPPPSLGERFNVGHRRPLVLITIPRSVAFLVGGVEVVVLVTAIVVGVMRGGDYDPD